MFFYRNRPFTQEDFKAFMFEQSQPLPHMLDFLRRMKSRHNLRMIAVSNEGRELAVYRVKKYQLGDFIDSFVVSSFVHLRKPDPQIYHLALDLAQVPVGQVIYIEDRVLSIEAAEGLGIPSVHHSGFEATRDALARMGLSFEPREARIAAGVGTRPQQVGRKAPARHRGARN